eukprot:COSAG06_NODE_917_length_11555_cov_62.488041_6_plen_76_part_00
MRTDATVVSLFPEPSSSAADRARLAQRSVETDLYYRSSSSSSGSTVQKQPKSDHVVRTVFASEHTIVNSSIIVWI